MTIKEMKEAIASLEKLQGCCDDTKIMFSLPEDPSQYFTSEGCMFLATSVELNANQG